MTCVVTAGPTCEPLDEVRRLTNFSTGRLGCELANHLVDHGHTVILLRSELATWPGPHRAQILEPFTTSSSLREALGTLARQPIGAVFHAAAVSDFRFGKVWRRAQTGKLSEIAAAKLSTRGGALLAELLPTPKIILELRALFPNARLVGWKYELEGDRERALALACEQIRDCRTDLCVANGRAYGEGFGVVSPGGDCRHCPDKHSLFGVLGETVIRRD